MTANMTQFTFKHSFVIWALVLLSATSNTWAQRLSASEAAEQARQFTTGKVLKVKQVNSQYRVKMLLPQGQVRHIIVDGNNGSARFNKQNHKAQKTRKQNR